MNARHSYGSLSLASLVSFVVIFATLVGAQSGHTWWTSVLDQSFESGFTPGHNINGQSNWAVTQPASDTSMYWRTAGYTHPQNGPSRAANLHWNSNPAADADDYTVRLSTPLLASGTTGTELYFDYWLDLFTLGETHNLKVLITFNDWSTSTVIGTIQATSSLQRTTYFVDLAAAGATGSATYKIGFQAEGEDTELNLNGFWLDDIVVLTGAVGSPSTDGYEPNNTVAAASIVSLPFSDPNFTITAGDSDYFTFVAGGGLIDVTIDASGQLAAELYRVTSTGALALACREASFTGMVQLRTASPVVEEWVLRVCGVSSTTTGGYALDVVFDGSVNDWAEINDSVATAYDAGLFSTFGLDNLCVEANDVDYFVFEGNGVELTIYDILYSASGQTLRGTLYTATTTAGPWTQVATADIVEGVATSAMLSEDDPRAYLVRVEKPFPATGETTTHIVYSIASNDWGSATNSSSVTLALVPNQAVRVGELVAFQLDATASNANHALRYSIASSPSGVVVNDVTGDVEWVPGEEHRGLNLVVLEVHNWGDDHVAFTADDSTDQVVVQITVESLFEVVPTQRAGTLQAPIGGAMSTGEGVSVSTGEFSHGVTLFSIPGRALPLSFSMGYRSNLDYDGPLGRGWTSPAFQFLRYDDVLDAIHQFDGAGRFDTFNLQSGGTVGEGPYVCTGYGLEFWRDDMSTTSTAVDDVIMMKWPDGSTLSFMGTNTDSNGDLLYRPFISSDRYYNMVIYLHDTLTGRLQEIRGDLYSGSDPNNHRILFEYDYLGRLSKVRDFADYSAHSAVLTSYLGEREWDFGYDVDGNLVEVALPKTARYYSDAKGFNYRTRIGFSYDGDSRMLGVFDARQMNESSPLPWLLNEYDPTTGKVIQQDVGREYSADATKARTIHYTSSTEVNYIDALGHKSRYTLDGNRRVTMLRHYTGVWSDPTTMTGAKVRGSDPDYFETSWEYDSEFNIWRSVGPAGDEVHRLYDTSNASRLARGNLLRTLVLPSTSMPGTLPADQENGLLSVVTYNAPTANGVYNQVATTISAEAFEVPTGWAITDALPSPNDAADYTVTFEYNGSSSSYGPLATLRRVLLPTAMGTHALSAGQTGESLFEHNSHGQLTSSTNAEGIETAMTYGTSGTGRGRLVSVAAGAQTSSPITSSLVYDRLGAVIETVDPMSNVSKSFRNQLDQLVRSETPVLSAISTNYWSTALYDLNGNLEVSSYSNIDETGATGKDGFGNTVANLDTLWVYDQMDMVTSVTHAANVTAQAVTSTFYYDNMFRGVGRRLPEGNMDAADLDELGRSVKVYWGFDSVNVLKAAALVKSEIFYDIASNVVKTVDGSGIEHLTEYDGYHRPVKNIGPDVGVAYQFMTTLEYDRASRVVNRKGWSKAPSAAAVQYAESKSYYDNWGRLSAAMTKAVTSTGADLGYSAYELTANFESGWSTARFKYRKDGQISELVDDLGYKRFMYYDDYGRQFKTKDDLDPSGTLCNSDEVVYDANSRVITTIAKYVDQSNSSSPIKTIQSDFEYDELGRKVKSIAPELEVSYGRHFQTWQYDSRSNVVRAVDRMGTAHRYVYDALSRPISSFTDDVTFYDIHPTGKTVSTSSANIENSRTYYDKNSNVTKVVDANGNTTMFRRDLAHRWLQTLLPDDDGASNPNRVTAGNGHTIASVGSPTSFYAKSGTYDDSGNLIARTDANGTVVGYTYDSYGRLTQEQANISVPVAANLPIVGEDTVTYTYDWKGNLNQARTLEGSTERTKVTSIWNSLGKLEHQYSTITDPITSTPYYTSVRSSWDESGRRYQRRMEDHDITTNWRFDRLHRPVDTIVSQILTGGTDRFATLSNNVIEEFKYIGGGFTHVEQKRYAPEDANNYSLSKYEHDNWMRVTKVRHSVTDTSTSTSDGLLTAWEARYNANNMMVYEGYWYGTDTGGAADSPTGVNLFYHDERNLLVKAIYNAKLDGYQHTGMTIAAAEAGVASLGASNNLPHTDRMVYDIRNTGGRRAVNWYRAMPTPANVPDSTNPADQLTSYATGEFVANGAAITEKTPGTGEQGEYKGIGLPSPNYEYDNNKNVISDPTRKFEYNYKNQMRSVSRKSDGDTLVRYMHDAGGREVWNQRRWYVGRHETLDTRFPLDVDLDADNNSTYMVCSDGGIANWEEYDTSWSFEESNWPGLLGFHNNGAENHYFDFQVYVPAYESDTYLGYVAYDIATVHIFSNRVVLTFDRNDYSPSAPGYQSEPFTWTGWHNIGINIRGHSVGTKVWIDGSDVITSGMGSPQPDVKAWFASHRAHLAPYSLAVHAFASYRANWEWEIGNVRPVTSVKSSDGITPGAEVNDATWTPELAYATLGSSSTYLARGLSGDLMVQHALPNTRHCNVVWASCEVDDGMSGATLGVIATNTPSESGDPNIHRPAMTSLSTYSPYFELPTELSGEYGSTATPMTPANYSVGGMSMQVVVNGTGDFFVFDGDDIALFALDSGTAGPEQSVIGRAGETYGVCGCRESNVSNDSNCIAFVDNTGLGLGDQMGNFGDPMTGMQFGLPSGLPPTFGELCRIREEYMDVQNILDTLEATEQHWEDKIEELKNELWDLDELLTDEEEYYVKGWTDLASKWRAHLANAVERGESKMEIRYLEAEVANADASLADAVRTRDSLKAKMAEKRAELAKAREELELVSDKLDELFESAEKLEKLWEQRCKDAETWQEISDLTGLIKGAARKAAKKAVEQGAANGIRGAGRAAAKTAKKRPAKGKNRGQKTNTTSSSQSPTETPERNPAQDRKLSHGDIEELKKQGYDPHELKGGKGASKRNLYKDKHGNVYEKPGDGSGPGNKLGFKVRPRPDA